MPKLWSLRPMALATTHTTMGFTSFILSSLLITIIISPLLITPTSADATAHHHRHRHRHRHRHHHPRSLHFSLFQHETINKTGYFVVAGVAGPGVSQTTTPFGTMFVFQDPLTTTADRASKLVGTAEGTSITSSLDGLRSISIAKVSLRMRRHLGSLSIVGGTHNVKPSNHPVVGGTGDFLFVQGYVTSSPVDLTGVTVVYKLEFHLYWPPYAKPPQFQTPTPTPTPTPFA